MSTQSEFRTETPQTQVADLPPMTVVTEGIPASEHVEAAPTAAPTGRSADRESRIRRIVLALEGLLVLVILGAFAVGITELTAPPSPGLHMGLSPTAWSEFRAGERAPATAPATSVAAWTPWVVTTPWTSS
jgi:hypothetical protein